MRPRQIAVPTWISILVLATPSPAQQGKNSSPKKPTDPSITWVNEAPADKEIPPPLTHKTFHSEAAGRDVGYTILVALDVDHTYIELEGLAHSRAKMIETLRPVWFDYHVESMRRASESHSKSSK